MRLISDLELQTEITVATLPPVSPPTKSVGRYPSETSAS
jgi:hypothetical protein